MHKVICAQFQDGCSSPLCPLDENSIINGIWYPVVEEICHRRDAPNWVRKQKAVVKARAPSDRYFTSAMLQAISQVRIGIEGINPDQPLEKAKEAERKWIAEKKAGRVIAKKNQKPARVIAKKRDNLVFATNTSNQEIGGQK